MKCLPQAHVLNASFLRCGCYLGKFWKLYRGGLLGRSRSLTDGYIQVVKGRNHPCIPLGKQALLSYAPDAMEV